MIPHRTNDKCLYSYSYYFGWDSTLGKLSPGENPHQATHRTHCAAAATKSEIAASILPSECTPAEAIRSFVVREHAGLTASFSLPTTRGLLTPPDRTNSSCLPRRCQPAAAVTHDHSPLPPAPLFSPINLSPSVLPVPRLHPSVHPSPAAAPSAVDSDNPLATRVGGMA